MKQAIHAAGPSREPTTMCFCCNIARVLSLPVIDCGRLSTVYNAWVEGSNTTYGSTFTFTAVNDFWFKRGVRVMTTTCSVAGTWVPTINDAIRKAQNQLKFFHYI
jgi:hypothetical protein